MWREQLIKFLQKIINDAEKQIENDKESQMKWDAIRNQVKLAKWKETEKQEIEKAKREIRGKYTVKKPEQGQGLKVNPNFKMEDVLFEPLPKKEEKKKEG